MNRDLSNFLLLIMVTFSLTSLFAQAGNCLSFDGSEDFISMPDSPSVDIVTEITLEAWIRMENLTSYPGIIAKGYETNGGYSIQIRIDGTIWFELEETDGTRHFYNPTTQILPTNTWIHLATTYNGVTQRIYLNGQEVGSGLSGSFSIGDIADQVYIGHLEGYGFFDGQIDEVRIWNIARSQTQIQQNMQHPIDADETGLVAYYRFDQSGGTTLEDLTIHNNDGTLNNFTLPDAWTDSTAPLISPSGNFLEFDGGNDYISIDHMDDLNFNTFTISFWLKPQDSGLQFLITKYNEVASEATFRLYLDGVYLTADTFIPARVFSGTYLTAGIWQYIAFTYDGAFQNLYVNGNLVDSDAQNGVLNTNSDPINLGCRNFNGSLQDFARAGMDEVRFWNTARSQTQIQDNMNALINGDEPGLIAGYRFDQGDAGQDNACLPNELIDYAGSHKGTLNGFALNGTTSNWCFTGLATTPILTTSEVENIGAFSAQVSGEIFSIGSEDVTTRGVCYSTSDCPTIGDNTVQENGSFCTGPFTLTVNGLDIRTTYYTRAYAVNGSGISYGETQQYTTAGFPSGNCLDFDGGNDYVSLPDLNLESYTITMEAWVKPNGVQSDNAGIIISRTENYHQDTAIAGIFLRSDNELRYDWDSENSGFPTGLYLTDNEWNHVALVISPQGATVFLNGYGVSHNVPHAMVEFNMETSIGRDASYSGHFFRGQIDDVRVWNVSRTPTQIQNNMNTLLTGDEPGLVAFYRFDQGNAGQDNTGLPNELIDYAGNYKGTLNNFAMTGTTSNWCSSVFTLTPLVAASGAENITTISADISGVVFDTGVGDCYARGFCYSHDDLPDITDNITEDSGCFGNGPFMINISGLTPDTDYHYRAYAINDAGISYSETRLLRTASMPTDGYFEIGDGTTDFYCIAHGYWLNRRTQTTYYASELTAAGMVAGEPIEGIQWDWTHAPALDEDQYCVRLGHTGYPEYYHADYYNYFLRDGLIEVFNSGPVYFNVSQGWAGVNFTTPFIWNGVDNVVVDVCMWNEPGAFSYSPEINSTHTNSNRSCSWQSDGGINPTLDPQVPAQHMYVLKDVPNVRFLQYQAGTPGIPQLIAPVFGAGNQNVDCSLEWVFGPDTDAYDLWLGEPGNLVQVVAGGSATPGGNGAYVCNVDYLTNYQWYVVGWNTTLDPPLFRLGDAWEFSTGPYYTNLLPADKSSEQPLDTSLSWDMAETPNQINIRFGEDPDLANNPLYSNVSIPWYPPGLAPLTRYYWQAETTLDGTQWIRTDTFSFTTLRVPDTALILPWTEDFESVGPQQLYEESEVILNGLPVWEYFHEGLARLQFACPYFAAQNGMHCAAMDCNGTRDPGTNYLTASLNLSNYSTDTGTVSLSFWHYNAEDDWYGDGVWVRGSTSDDWIQIINIDDTPVDFTWIEVTGLNVSQTLADAGQQFSDEFQLRFGRVGWAFLPLRGRAFDNISLEYTADVPVFAAIPNQYDFGDVPSIDTESQDFIITNIGGGTLTINEGSISIVDDPEGNYTLEPITFPIELNTGQTDTLHVTFAPQSLGEKTATLQIADNMTRTPNNAGYLTRTAHRNDTMIRAVHTVPLIGNAVYAPHELAPYSQNFDTWPPGTIVSDGWVQETDDNLDWIINQYSTPTPDTGPSDDMTGGGKYLYTETESSNYEDAILVSPYIDVSTLSIPRISFWYHMYGADMGSLTVQVNEYASTVWTDVWGMSGDQGNQWHRGLASLDGYQGIVRIRFVGFLVPGNLSDMAIDDFAIEETPTVPMYSCEVGIDDFGPWFVGQSSDPSLFRIVNAGSGSLDIDNIHLAGADTVDFKLAYDQTLPTSIPETGYLDIEVWFQPHSEGAKTVSLEISDTILRTPHTYPLSGTALPPATVPYLENFDALIAPDLPNGWIVDDVNADGKTWSSNSLSVNAHSGTMVAWLRGPYELSPIDDWLYSKPVWLDAGLGYRVSWWGRDYSTYHTPHHLDVWIMDAQDPDATVHHLASYIQNTTVWTENSGIFIPETSGPYFIGWHGDSPQAQYNYYMDDVSIESAPASPNYVCTPNQAAFGVVDLHVTSTPVSFSVHNDGLGAIGINGVSISGQDSGDFDFTMNLSIPVSLTTELLQIDVSCTPLTEGEKNASLDITDDQGRVVHSYPLTATGVNYSYGGGTEDSGYYYFSNSSLGAVGAASYPTFNWIDISATGTEMSIPDDDEFVDTPISIGFAFPYFGNSYNEIYFSSNGWLSFDGSIGSSYYNNSILPSSNDPNDLIAWFWDDMDPEDNPDDDTHVYYQTTTSGVNQIFVISMIHYHEYPGEGPGNLTAQVILYDTGKIKMQYLSFDEDIVLDECVVGIESSDGSQGICYTFHGDRGPLYDGLAIAYGTDPHDLGDLTSLESPTDVILHISGFDVVLSWNSVPGATSYLVYRADNPDGPFSVVAGPVFTTSFTDISAATALSYWYYVTSTDQTTVGVRKGMEKKVGE